jgi:hypothetical protein
VLRAVYGFVGPDELIEIGLKRSSENGSGWQSVFTGLEDLIAGGLTFIQTSSREGADAYIGACTIVGGPPERGRGNASVRGRAGALWVDLDCQAPGRDGPQYFVDVEHAWGVLEAVLDRVGLPGAADVVVGSGWGVQAWIRLTEPVDARVASRWTRALISEIRNGPECEGRMQVDRVWDVTRVLRFPGGGTYNWRGGEDFESEVTVLRLPSPDSPGVELGKIEAALGASDRAEQDRFISSVGFAFSPGDASRALLDMEAIFDRLTWSQVLEPFGWHKVGGNVEMGMPGEMEVWLRPGKVPQGSALRSAVVYGDAPGVLVVHSDSLDTGLPGWWETRSQGGREEGGSRRANTRWRAFMRLRAQHERLLEPGGLGDEDAAERKLRIQAVDIAMDPDRVGDSAWPEAVEAALRDDGRVALNWINGIKNSKSDRLHERLAREAF